MGVVKPKPKRRAKPATKSWVFWRHWGCLWALSIVSLVITWIMMYEISTLSFVNRFMSTPGPVAPEEFPSEFMTQPKHRTKQSRTTRETSDEDLKVRDILASPELSDLWQEILLHRNRPPDAVYKLNVTLSDQITLNRVLRDQRPPSCPNVFPQHLPNATVIIPFHNEALSMLLRTVHSILWNSPIDLLDKVVLVDDKSDNEDLGGLLSAYILKLPKVQLIRNERREGLIKSRMIGASNAHSEVLIFMDAHMEATVGWLPPLLRYLKNHPRAVIQPEVDEIDPDTLAYFARSKHTNYPHDKILQGGFNWDLRYAWIPLPAKVNVDRKTAAGPYPSATLVGCAIVVKKTEFFELGAFDDDMEIWGGENIELAFRAWQCHRSVMTIPCSRVGHMFKPFSYDFAGKSKEVIVGSNLMRIAEIWMDDFKRFFYGSWRAFPFKRNRLTGEQRKSIKRRYNDTRLRLKCRGFDWYMKNIAFNLNIPPSDALYFGEIWNQKSRNCLKVAPDGYVVIHYECYSTRVMPENEFYINNGGQLKLLHAPSADLCIMVEYESGLLKQSACSLRHEQWRLYGETTYGHLIVAMWMNPSQTAPIEYCLVQITNVNAPHYGEQLPQIAACDEMDDWQRWIFNYKFDYLS